MSQVLVIENNSDLSKVLKLNLMKSFDFEVIEKSSVREGLELIEILPAIDLILMNEKIDDVEVINDLIEYLKNNSYLTPIILVGSQKRNYDKIHLVDPNSSWKVMVDMVGKITGKTASNTNRGGEAAYLPIPVSYFLNIQETSMGCDVYIRVKKTEGDFQYIKRLNSTDSFNRAEIEKYMSQGLKEFYIPKEHFTRFVDYVTDQLTLKFISPDKNTNSTQFNAEAYDVTRDRIASLGIDERTVALVEENLKGMSRTLGDKNALSDYLNNLRNNTMSFAYSHSYLTCLLLNKILKSFEWESAAVREKITYICYFHDISLKEDELIKISNQEELDKLELSREKQSLVLNHANKSAEIVDQFPQVPIGVSSLIREHHGIKTGVGFRTQLTITLSPVSMMFVVTEDFVHKFLTYPTPPNKDQIIQIFKELEQVYNKVTYAQTLLALQNSILGNK